MKRKHPMQAKTKHKPSPVKVRQLVHPRIWKTAMKVAGNDHRRIEVVSFTNVMVRINGH